MKKSNYPPSYEEVKAREKEGEKYEAKGDFKAAERDYQFAELYYFMHHKEDDRRRMVDKIRQIRMKTGRLNEKSLGTALLAIASILSGLFFLSPNMTGNAISNLTNSTSNIFGAVLLVIGLVAGAFWMKKS